MGKLRLYISLLAAKMIKGGLNITKLSAGTSVIGKIVLKINPNFLSDVNSYIKTKINITGTNGKTTTSGLITHLIKQSGHTVINNSLGANMLTGVVNALSTELNPFTQTEFSVIESDEAYLSKIYDKFEADYLLVTNLFRDQLDRYGELATTKKLIQDGINKKPDLKLILNADDPLVSSFEGGSEHIFYGIEKVIREYDVKDAEAKTEEAFNCPCGKPLKYSRKFFAQQGHYYCECGFKRPEVKYNGVVKLFKDYSIVNINGEEFEIPLIGLFNAYNAIGAIALAKELGISNIQENIKTFKVAFGRSEVKYINGKKTLIQLIKNPIGANEVLKTVDLNSDILIIINDNYADGRDVSWLWDAEFENLAGAKHEIIVSGIRANDIALRLKYAGVDSAQIKIIPDIKHAVNYIGRKAENNITILPTYTALLKLNKISNIKKVSV